MSSTDLDQQDKPIAKSTSVSESQPSKTSATGKPNHESASASPNPASGCDPRNQNSYEDCCAALWRAIDDLNETSNQKATSWGSFLSKLLDSSKSVSSPVEEPTERVPSPEPEPPSTNFQYEYYADPNVEFFASSSLFRWSSIIDPFEPTAPKQPAGSSETHQQQKPFLRLFSSQKEDTEHSKEASFWKGIWNKPQTSQPTTKPHFSSSSSSTETSEDESKRSWFTGLLSTDPSSRHDFSSSNTSDTGSNKPSGQSNQSFFGLFGARSGTGAREASQYAERSFRLPFNNTFGHYVFDDNLDAILLGMQYLLDSATDLLDYAISNNSSILILVGVNKFIDWLLPPPPGLPPEIILPPIPEITCSCSSI